MKKISVIVPVYNVEDYLEKCLSSVVNQTLQDIEIIVVNDGSTDSSQKIIDQFQQEFPEKIKSLKKENGGLSDARNFGIDHAEGNYIAFVDSDDYIEKTMLEEMYHLAIQHNAEMVICNIQKVNEAGIVTQRLTQIPNMPEKIDLLSNFSVFSDLSYFACNKIFSRNLFKDKRFTKGIHFEDIDLIPQLLLSCKTIAQTQTYHYNYLERISSISKTHTERGLDILKAVKKVEEVFVNSQYHARQKELKNFQILEGVYTFLAYLAYVKNEHTYQKMSAKLKDFIQKKNITRLDILRYKRFGKNYWLSLPFKKKIYYLLYILGLERVIRKII